MIAAPFTRKKVVSMTLGERFRKIRSERRISLMEVSRATKIRVRYLEAIEEGEYDKLPAEVYVRGFLRSYASYLVVPEDAILRLYERERNIRKNLGHIAPFRSQPTSPVRFSFVPSSRTVAVAIGATVAIGFFAYLYLELRSFVSEPRLVIENPVDGATVDGETIVRGKTDPRAQVLINGEETIVDEEGAFAQRLTLTAGLNVISVSSTNRFGKERARTISVSVDLPDVPEADRSGTGSAISSGSGVTLSLRVLSGTALSVSTDGETVWSGELAEDGELPFEAEREIAVSADEGTDVLVRYGDGEEEPLSETDGPATVTFGPDGRAPDGPLPKTSEREADDTDIHS